MRTHDDPRAAMDISDYEAIELAKALDLMTVPPYYLPDEKAPRLTRAHKWVREGKVHDMGNGTYTVDGSKPGTTYTLQDTHCTCEHAHHAKSRWCYHACAVKLYQEWQRRLQPLAPPVAPPPQDTPVQAPRSPQVPRAAVGVSGDTMTQENTTMETPRAPEVPPPAPALMQVPPPRVNRDYLVTIKGRTFVQFAGLLALAHSHGLVSLSARFVSVTPTLALAEATAVFADGRSFSEAADATPENVNRAVAAHFARCALTRAKARALRDALNIAEVAVEELAEEAAAPVATTRRGAATTASPRQEIVRLLARLGFHDGSAEAYREEVQFRTGLALVPDNYGAIIAALTRDVEAAA